MSRRGFALLAVLWVIVSAGLLAATALTTARLGSSASRNRIMLLRSRWAREACAEILLARHERDPTSWGMDTVDLGAGAWCRAEVHDPDSRVDLNLASPGMLRAVLSNDSLTDALLDWRDGDDLPRLFGAEAEWYEVAGRRVPRNGALADVEELALVRGFERMGIGRRDSLFTVLGTGRVDLGLAPEGLLAALPGVSEEARRVLVHRRRSREPIHDLQGLVALLSPRGRDQLLARYDVLLPLVAFNAARRVALVEGGVRGAPLSSRLRLMIVPAGGRLAVVRREAE